MSVIDKVVSVLDVLSRAPEPMRLGAVAETLELPKSSLHRLLNDLVGHGLVRRVGDGDYALGYRVVEWSQRADGGDSLREAARPVMRDLRDQVQESVYLHLPEGDHRVCVDTAPGPHTVRPVLLIGVPMALGYGAAGRVLYAHASRAVRAQAARAYPTFRGRRVPTEEDAARVRSDGFAYSVGEMEDGLTSMAAPVHGPGGQVVAALAVASIESRMAHDRVPEVRAALHAAASRITEVLAGRLASSQSVDDR